MGKKGWDGFVQRAKLKEISQEESASDPLQLLLQATVEAIEGEDGPLSSANVAPSQALSALADAASNAQPAAAVAAQRAPLPFPLQPQTQMQMHSISIPAEQPPSFLLPQLTPSRPIIPSAHSLPDPFTTSGGMPQLPPPRGVTFEYATRRGSLPGFISSQHPQPTTQAYQPPPPPALSGSPGVVPPYYFPGNPHSQSHQPSAAHPPPPPTQASSHRRY